MTENIIIQPNFISVLVFCGDNPGHWSRVFHSHMPQDWKNEIPPCNNTTDKYTINNNMIDYQLYHAIRPYCKLKYQTKLK